MQPEAALRQARHRRSAIERVADQRKSGVGQMYANLMAAAGPRRDRHQRVRPRAPNRLDDRDRAPSRAAGRARARIADRHLARVLRMMRDRRDQLERVIEMAGYQRTVASYHAARANRLAQLQ